MLLGSTATTSGARMSNGLARQTKRETDIVTARGEVAYVTDQTRAFLTASAARNVVLLYGMAEQDLRSVPSAASDVSAILQAYSGGAAYQIATFR